MQNASSSDTRTFDLRDSEVIDLTADDDDITECPFAMGERQAAIVIDSDDDESALDSARHDSSSSVDGDSVHDDNDDAKPPFTNGVGMRSGRYYNFSRSAPTPAKPSSLSGSSSTSSRTVSRALPPQFVGLPKTANAAESEKELVSLLDIMTESVCGGSDKEAAGSSFGVDISDLNALREKHGEDGTPKNLKVVLHEHQVEGLAWLTKMEDTHIGGGILADDMGLGKTIQTLALIVGNRPPQREKIKGTLIVCPVSLMRQWEREIQTKTRGLKVLIHHGPGRTKSKIELREHDVVITSYTMVSSERESKFDFDVEKSTQVSKPGPLFRARWFRIVLDEAHTIKNHEGVTSRACCELVGKKKLCLTGTPIQNSAEEIFSLFRFLGIPAYSNYEKFMADIGSLVRLKKESAFTSEYAEKMYKEGIMRLQSVTKTFLLRRTKMTLNQRTNEPILQLPKRCVNRIDIDLAPAERDLYEAFRVSFLSQFEDLVAQGNVMRNYTHVLVMILRLRQICCHPHLVEELFNDYAQGKRTVGTSFTLPRVMHFGGYRSMVTSQNTLQNSVVDASQAGIDSYPEAPSVIKKTSLLEDDDDEILNACFNDGSSDMSPKRRNPSSFKENDPLQIDKKLRIARNLMTPAVFARVCSQANMENGILDSECPHCLDVMTDPIVTSCGHTFCRECITGYLFHGSTHSHRGISARPDVVRPCPICSHDVSAETLTEGCIFVLRQEGDCDLDSCDTIKFKEFQEEERDSTDAIEPDILPITKADRNKSNECGKPITLAESLRLIDKAIAAFHPDQNYLGFIYSSKMNIMIELLQQIFREEEGLKVVIFSQFTKMLDIVETALRENGMEQYGRYDGKMSVRERSDAVDDFLSEDIPILLVSLKAGAVGLNLTRASRVILLDVWWNPAVEEQAIDRVHRIGQTRDVYVYRLVVKDSVEDQMLCLQERKREIAKGAVGEGDIRLDRLTLEDLKFLFGATTS